MISYKSQKRSWVYQPLTGVASYAKQQFLQESQFDDWQVSMADDEVCKHISDSQIILHHQYTVMLLDKRLNSHVHLKKTLQKKSTH